MTTFVVRVAGIRRGCLRGNVSLVASGETRAFADGSSLLAILEEWAAAHGIASAITGVSAGVARAGRRADAAEPGGIEAPGTFEGPGA